MNATIRLDLVIYRLASMGGVYVGVCSDLGLTYDVEMRHRGTWPTARDALAQIVKRSREQLGDAFELELYIEVRTMQ